MIRNIFVFLSFFGVLSNALVATSVVEEVYIPDVQPDQNDNDTDDESSGEESSESQDSTSSQTTDQGQGSVNEQELEDLGIGGDFGDESENPLMDVPSVESEEV